MTPLTLQSTARLRNGVEIPRLGLGVFRTGRGEPTVEAVRAALRAGYRHVDTARIYRNEEDVGRGLRASGVPRDEVFVTTKLWNADQGYDSTLRACEASLRALDLDHVDLYLVHWPVASTRLDSWRAMERLLEEGRCRAIGVSNFMPRHLEELLAHAEVAPMVDQVEAHPFLQQRALRSLCARHGIVVEAYSPLTKGRRLDDPVVSEIAAELGRSAAQVLIRWSLERGMVCLPKSESPARIEDNARVFDFALSEAQAERLDALEEGLHTAWDPTDAP